MLIILIRNTNTVKKNTEAMLEASMEVGLKVNITKLSIPLCFATKMQGKITVY